MNEKVLWALGISGLVILALAALLFWLPAPTKNAEQATDSDTTQGSPALSGAVNKNTASSGAGARTFEKGVYVTTVFLTNSGFVPESVVINKGEEVRFVNKTSLTMRVGSQVENLSSPVYSAIADPKAESKGGTYQRSFTDAGLWAYFNMTGDPFKGTIFVK